MKAFFLSRLLREKILLLAFLLLICGVWANSAYKRSTAFSREYSGVALELKEQAAWLGSREQIEADAAHAISQLDPAQTLDSSKLLAEVNRLAAEVGITSNMRADDTRDEHSSQFSLHSIRVTLTKVEYSTLVKFYMALQKRTPYIGLEQFSLHAPQASNPSQLTAMFRLSSVEVAKQ